ncbi:MAG: hypothetical protein HN368_04960 [Spirochaetales bacterium]|nr:hypothetical protein [Spirochaetales bacterium]
MKNLQRVIAGIVLILFAAIPMFAAGTDEASETGPMRIVWGGLAKNAGGVRVFPNTDAAIVAELNRIFNVELIPWDTDPFNAQARGLAFAAGNMPDFILTSMGQVQTDVEQGVFREVPWEMAKKYMPENARLLEENVGLENYKEYAHWVNGKMYGGLNSIGSAIVIQQVIRTDWLRNVGLNAPTTLAEFAEVMKAFTFNDPDGNGKNDTYGMMLSAVHETYLSAMIEAAFGIYGASMVDEGRKMVPTSISETYKSFLEYMNSLWEMGVVHPDLSKKNKEFQNYFSDGTVGFMQDTWTWVLQYYRPTGWYANFFAANPGGEADLMNSLVGEDSIRYTANKANHWVLNGITKDVDDAKAIKIMEILDRQLTDMDVHNLIWDGIEGVHFTFNEEGMRLPDTSWSTGDKYPEFAGKYFINNTRMTNETLIASYGGAVAEIQEFGMDWNITQNPFDSSFQFTEGTKNLQADVNTITSEYKWKVIVGEKNLTSDWDVYVAAWKKAGGDKMTAEWLAHLGM